MPPGSHQRKLRGKSRGKGYRFGYRGVLRQSGRMDVSAQAQGNTHNINPNRLLNNIGAGEPIQRVIPNELASLSLGSAIL